MYLEMQTIIVTSPRSSIKIESPHVEIDLDLWPLRKIDMEDSIQPIVATTAVATPTNQVEYTRCDGPYSTKDGRQLMFLRQERAVTFDVETGEIIDDTKSYGIPYSVEVKAQADAILAKFGKIVRKLS